MSQQQVEQERERLRVTLSLQFSRQVRGVVASHVGPTGMVPTNDSEYLAKLRETVADYARNLELLGGVG